MPDITKAALLGVFILASAVWIGGFVAVVVVARVANRTLPPIQRVAFFAGLGRAYGVVGGSALVVAMGTGAGLVADRRWDATLAAATAVAAALVVSTVIGVAQARRMTRLRRSSLQQPDNVLLARRVQQGARRAAVLRAGIGLLSLALIALGVLVAT